MLKNIFALLLTLGVMVGAWHCATAPDESDGTQTNVSEIPQAALDAATVERPNTDVPVVKGAVEGDGTFFNNLWEYLRDNLMVAVLGLMGLIEIFVRLTPTEKDNAWFNWLKNLIDMILPNKKVNGGKHETPG